MGRGSDRNIDDRLCIKIDELGSHEFGAEAATAKRPSLVFAVVRHAVDLSDYDTEVIRLFHEAAFVTIVGKGLQVKVTIFLFRLLDSSSLYLVSLNSESPTNYIPHSTL